MLRWLDNQAWAQTLLHQMPTVGHSMPVRSPSVAFTLPQPLILAAGFVKGDGFESEDEQRWQRLTQRKNIIPGWRSMPTLVGPVEFGSFTRWPRIGNPGTVMWRDVAHTIDTESALGLRNPGAKAAAAFLAQHRDSLPICLRHQYRR